jgi:hypothetical protein
MTIVTGSEQKKSNGTLQCTGNHPLMLSIGSSKDFTEYYTKLFSDRMNIYCCHLLSVYP